MPLDVAAISEQLIAVNDLEPLSIAHPSRFVSPSIGPAVVCLTERLATIVAARNGLEATLSDIQELEHKTRQRLNSLTNLLSPIFRLPTEIILNILQYGFVACLEECNRLSIPSDPTAYLLAITQTCRDWRADTFGLPQLWRRIHVEWKAEKREAWLQRAGENAPLDIYMQGINEVRLSSYNIVETADIFRHTIRWRSISISHCGNPVTYHFLRTVLAARTHFPILESVVAKLSSTYRGLAVGSMNNALLPASGFVDEGGEMYKNDEEEQTTTNGLPLLHHLVLHRADFSFGNLILHTTSLEINSYRPAYYDKQAFGRSLMQARTLKSLSLSQLSLEWDSDMCTPEQGYPVHKERLECLESLVLGLGNNAGAIQFVMHEIQAASLRYFCLRLSLISTDDILNLSNCFSAFLSSSPLIETLIMYGNMGCCGELLRDVANDAPGTSLFLRHLQNLTLGPDDRMFYSASSSQPSLNIHIVKLLIERQLRLNPESTCALRSLSIVDGSTNVEEQVWLRERVHRLVIPANASSEEDKEYGRYKAVQALYRRQGKVLDSQPEGVYYPQEADPDTDDDAADDDDEEEEEEEEEDS